MENSSEKNQEILFKPGEIAEKLSITTMTLTKWVQHFEIETEWSNPDNAANKGHRRYTSENLATLLKIKEKVQDQNWSWQKTKAFLNGDETVNVQLKTGLEMEIFELRKDLAADREKNAEFQESLMQNLSKLVGQLEKTQSENVELKKAIMHQNEQLQLEQSISSKKEKTEIENEKEGFFFKWFGPKKAKRQG